MYGPEVGLYTSTVFYEPEYKNVEGFYITFDKGDCETVPRDPMKTI